jgi:hypothetical protein
LFKSKQTKRKPMATSLKRDDKENLEGRQYSTKGLGDTTKQANGALGTKSAFDDVVQKQQSFQQTSAGGGNSNQKFREGFGSNRTANSSSDTAAGSGAADKIREGYDATKEKASELATATSEKLREGYDSAKEMASDVAHTASEKIHHGFETVKSAVTDAADAVKTHAKDFFGGSSAPTDEQLPAEGLKEITSTGRDASHDAAKRRGNAGVASRKRGRGNIDDDESTTTASSMEEQGQEGNLELRGKGLKQQRKRGGSAGKATSPAKNKKRRGGEAFPL